MDLAVMAEQACTVRRGFAQLETRRYGRQWTLEEVMLGFVGDVGDLANWSKARQGSGPLTTSTQSWLHELADCLWAVLTLADLYAVDLEAAFGSTMADLRRWLDCAEEKDHSPPFNDQQGTAAQTT